MRFPWTKDAEVELAAGQRWLVRARSKTEVKRLKQRGDPQVFDKTIGMVSSSGTWFKWGDKYSVTSETWHTPDEYEWLDKLTEAA